VEWIVLNFTLVNLLVAVPSCTEDPFFLMSRTLTPSSKHFCSVLLHDWCGVSTLCICVYLPHNDGSVASHNDFLITLGELEGFIDRHNSDHLLIAGDLNVDFSHPSIPLQHLRNFMADLSLVSADLPFHPAIHFTYMRDDGCAHCWPDHFLCDTSLDLISLFFM